MWLILQLDYCRKGLKFCHIQRLQKSRSLAICCSYHVSCLCVCLRKCLHLCVAFSINCLVSICILMYGNKLKQWRKGNGFFFFSVWFTLYICLLLHIFYCLHGRSSIECEAMEQICCCQYLELKEEEGIQCVRFFGQVQGSFETF